MPAILSREFAFRTGDFDLKKQILPTAVLDIFQTAAGEHSEHINASHERLIQNNMAWILMRAKYEVIKQPRANQNLTITTWPLPAGRVSYLRETEITDKNGEVLIKGSSEWVIIDILKRRILPAKNIYEINQEEYCTRLLFEGKFAKISIPEKLDNSYEFSPQYCDLDSNGHTNNAKYGNYIFNGLIDKKEINFFQIDYHKELLENSKTKIEYYNIENGVVVLGKSNEEKKFSAKILWK